MKIRLTRYDIHKEAGRLARVGLFPWHYMVWTRRKQMYVWFLVAIPCMWYARALWRALPSNRYHY